MKDLPYHYLPDGTFRNPEGSPERDPNFKWNMSKWNKEKKKIKIIQLKDGQFVGEMSFLTEKPATATCVVRHNAELLVWRQREFKELLKRNPSLYYSIQSLLSTQLVSISSN